MKEAQILNKILGFLFIATYSNAKYLLVEVEDRIVGQGGKLGSKDLQELPPQKGMYIHFEIHLLKNCLPIRASKTNNA